VIADWSVEVGQDCPSIDVPWEGWLDLRPDLRPDPIADERSPGSEGPDAASTLAEAQLYPELLDLLKLANSGALFTSKVDVFPVSREDADPEIAEAGEPATRFGLGSYVDLAIDPPKLPLHPELSQFAHFEPLTRMLAAKLGKIELSGICSAEIVLRPAHLFGRESFGWSVYTMGFGPTEAAAREVWARAVAASLIAIAAELAAFPAKVRPSGSLEGVSGTDPERTGE